MRRSLRRVRFSPLAVAVALLALPFISDGAAAQGGGFSSIQPHVLLDDDSIRLKDLFTDPGAYGDRVVARAPLPGRKLVLEAQWLQRVARAYRVSWRPLNRFERVVVERASRIVSSELIAGTVTAILREREDVHENDLIEIDNAQQNLHLPASFPAKVEVESLSYDAASRRFAARIAAPDNRPGAVRATVTGQVHAMVDVPVLVRRLRPGERIRPDDIGHISMRADQIGPQTVVSRRQLAGMTPRRPVLENRPVRSDEIESPRLVERGGPVTILYETHLMRLSAAGRALEHGTEGQSVRVKNTHSNKVVDGIVAGSGIVVVGDGFLSQ